MELNRKKEILDVCLEVFMTKGLSETSTRDIAKALNIQNAGLYYYFKTKSDAVVACFEEALSRIEINLVLPAVVDIGAPDRMLDNLLSAASGMKGLVRFIYEAYSSFTYRESLIPALTRLNNRMSGYLEMISTKLRVDSERIKPYYDMMTCAVIDYLYWEKKERISLPFSIVKEKLTCFRDGTFQQGDPVPDTLTE